MTNNNKESKHFLARPFVKWAGGKRYLLNILESQLPMDIISQDNFTYIEPFVGGGAMLFHMLNNYSNIKRVVISDVNQDLIWCYSLIKERPQSLISLLSIFEKEYLQLSDNDKKVYYYNKRHQFNSEKNNLDLRAALFIFLNHTCFNGLYRVNANGHFNVPFGKYKKPNICNSDIIWADHKILSKVDIYCGDYKTIYSHIGRGYNFIYFDPPYRPLQGSDNFNQYYKSGFGDKDQQSLKTFFDKLTQRGCKLMLSNSDSTNEDGSSYFESLYEGYKIGRILAPRYINAHALKRNKQKEVLIINYNETQTTLPLL